MTKILMRFFIHSCHFFLFASLLFFIHSFTTLIQENKKQFSVVDYICQSFIFINKNFIIRSDHSSLYILTTQSTCFCNNNNNLFDFPHFSLHGKYISTDYGFSFKTHTFYTGSTKIIF